MTASTAAESRMLRMFAQVRELRAQHREDTQSSTSAARGTEVGQQRGTTRRGGSGRGPPGLGRRLPEPGGRHRQLTGPSTRLKRLPHSKSARSTDGLRLSAAFSAVMSVCLA